MKYKSFRIINYKAIKDLVIEVNKPNLTPIIGLNETGKSSILQAIFAFDFFNDNQYNGEFINIDYIQNKYNKENPKIETEIENINIDDIRKNALDYIINTKKENFFMKSEYFKTPYFDEEKYLEPIKKLLKEKINNILSKERDNIIIIREFSQEGAFYSLKNFEVNEINNDLELNGCGTEIKNIRLTVQEIEDLISKSILTRLPYIIYVDDFKDIVPNKIPIKDEDVWYPYIKEIFFKNNKDLKNFISTSNLSDRETTIEDIKDELNTSLSELWDKMHISNTIKDEFKTIEIVLRFENNEFQFLINDLREKRENGRARKVVFPVHMRSKRFQWFFNFFIKMKYNWKHIDNESYGSIILLDEPGVYLHSTFQSELVKLLKDLSKNNIIFYTTHLENMVDPKVIKISQISIAKRKNEDVILEKITKIEDNKDLGEITPIINALKIDKFPLLHFNEKIIITEGITDTIFLKLLQEANLLDDSIKLIPGSGVSNLGTLISFSIGITNKYVVLFDSDNAGKEHFSSYQKEFGLHESKKWILHKLSTKQDDVVLEDYYNDEIKNILKTYTDSNDYKAALINFYYSNDQENKKFFFNELAKMSKKNENIYILLEQIKKRLN